MKVQTEKQYVIICHYCGESLVDGNKTTLLNWAKVDGWGTYKGENICPECKKDNKKKI